MKVAAAVMLSLALSACATDVPAGTEFDDSLGEVVVTVLGDGFVQLGDERMPLEAAALTLRQRTRGMTLDDRKRFVVRLMADPVDATPEIHKQVSADLDRMLDQLQIMGVVQVRYL